VAIRRRSASFGGRNAADGRTVFTLLLLAGIVFAAVGVLRRADAV